MEHASGSYRELAIPFNQFRFDYDIIHRTVITMLLYLRVESCMHVVYRGFQPDIASAAYGLVAYHEHAVFVSNVRILLDKQCVRVVIRHDERPFAPVMNLLGEPVNVGAGQFQVRQSFAPVHVFDEEVGYTFADKGAERLTDIILVNRTESCLTVHEHTHVRIDGVHVRFGRVANLVDAWRSQHRTEVGEANQVAGVDVILAANTDNGVIAQIAGTPVKTGAEFKPILSVSSFRLDFANVFLMVGDSGQIVRTFEWWYGNDPRFPVQ